MVGQLSAITLERCPRSAWNVPSRAVHAARQRRVGNPVPKAVLMTSVTRPAALSTAAASLATNGRRGGQGGSAARGRVHATDAVRPAAWPVAATRP